MNFNQLGSNLLVDSTGRTTSVSSALANKSGVALYFSAHWCPPCRQFTPLLAEQYKKSFKSKGLEIIFISSDRDEASFREYFSQMPWLALPFSERGIKEMLSSTFGISGIPALLVFDHQGKLVDRDGRATVMQNPAAFFGLSVRQSEIPKMPEIVKPAVTLDNSIQTTKLQFRFPDGRKTTQEFNETATVKSLKSFVAKCDPTLKSFQLAAGFPPKDLLEEEADVKTLGLFDSVVTVKKQ
jgi:nucleoredoxin